MIYRKKDKVLIRYNNRITESLMRFNSIFDEQIDYFYNDQVELYQGSRILELLYG